MPVPGTGDGGVHATNIGDGFGDAVAVVFLYDNDTTGHRGTKELMSAYGNAVHAVGKIKGRPWFYESTIAA